MPGHGPRFYTIIFVLLACFWGGSFVAIKEVVGHLPPWFSAAARLWVASISLFVLFKFFLKAPLGLPFRLWPRIWLTGLVTVGFPFALLFWGEQSISAGLAGIINGAVPLFTAAFVFALPTQDERGSMKLKTLVGLVLGFAGICTIFWPLVQAPSRGAFWGGLAVVGMACFYALGNIFNKRNFQELPQLSVYTSVFHQHMASLLFLSFGCLLMEENIPFQKLLEVPSLIPSIIYLGVFSTAVALTLYFQLLKVWGSVRTSAIAYLIPVATLLFDLIIFRNLPGPASLLGIVFIFAGIFCMRSDQRRSPEQELLKKAA